MATRRLLLPEQVRDALKRRYTRQRAEWLAGGGTWPLTLGLGSPSEKDARDQPGTVRGWADAWRSWRGIGQVDWVERRWSALGTQHLPTRVAFTDAEAVAAQVGEAPRWARARARFDLLTGQWPALASPLARYFDVLADYGEADFGRLVDLVTWLHLHPASGLYPRQVPVPGLDSKWFEMRAAMVADLLEALRPEVVRGKVGGQGIGLRPLPHLLRIRVLDPRLRQCLGGLSDITAPVGEVAALPIEPRQVFIVENLQTGLAFEDLPGTAVIMKLGYSVEVLGALPWLANARCLYWGDLDTHGFAILNRARTYTPSLASILMDEATLLTHRPLWGSEPRQDQSTLLPLLTAQEQRVYQGLRQQRWGNNVRLEQERIPWPYAWDAVLAAITFGG